ncbi:MAG: hypothetical protein HQL36_04890 [Alphaproteobacteria bacterium]|nr:hypothetical protein [Alphaproteobacteria bacterium]MBF0250463.1 hypothetical protein [Alphaproteobacteria bacterium]
MGWFGFGGGGGDKKPLKVYNPVDPGWVHGPDKGFFRLLTMDPEELGLDRQGGVYLIWHGGVRPEWVYAGHSKNLAQALHNAGNNKEIAAYDENGRLWVAWAPVKEPYRPGVVKYLQETFKTLVSNEFDFNPGTEAVPVTPPQRKK